MQYNANSGWIDRVYVLKLEGLLTIFHMIYDLYNIMYMYI